MTVPINSIPINTYPVRPLLPCEKLDASVCCPVSLNEGAGIVDPVITTCCNKVFQQACLIQWNTESPDHKCMNCQKIIDIGSLITKNEGLKGQINWLLNKTKECATFSNLIYSAINCGILYSSYFTLNSAYQSGMLTPIEDVLKEMFYCATLSTDRMVEKGLILFYLSTRVGYPYLLPYHALVALSNISPFLSLPNAFIQNAYFLYKKSDFFPSDFLKTAISGIIVPAIIWKLRKPFDELIYSLIISHYHKRMAYYAKRNEVVAAFDNIPQDQQVNNRGGPYLVAKITTKIARIFQIEIASMLSAGILLYYNSHHFSLQNATYFLGTTSLVKIIFDREVSVIELLCKNRYLNDCTRATAYIFSVLEQIIHNEHEHLA